MGCANSSTAVDKMAVVSATPGLPSVNLLERNHELRSPARVFKEGSISDFNFLGKLGQGAFGTVHTARCLKLANKTVAVKIMDLVDDEETLSDLATPPTPRLSLVQEEVAILRKITGGANVIDFYGFFTDKCLSFLVMEQCDGSLLQALHRLPAITESTITRILKEMLNGLASVHEAGIVHRDVKPANFLCVGPKDTVKLCDFGFAAILSPHQSDGLSGVFGTPPFMSPEMLLGRPYDQKSDVWSCGVIVYSLFYGRFPYEPIERSGKAMMKAIRTGIPAPSSRPPPVLILAAQKPSEGARQLAADMLQRSPNDRIASKLALRHHFFASPGKTDLAPMLASAEIYGPFCAKAGNDPSQKNEVDLRIEALQRQREESQRAESPKVAVADVHVPAVE